MTTKQQMISDIVKTLTGLPVGVCVHGNLVQKCDHGPNAGKPGPCPGPKKPDTKEQMAGTVKRIPRVGTRGWQSSGLAPAFKDRAAAEHWL